jgi:hypothetical protein
MVGQHESGMAGNGNGGMTYCSESYQLGDLIEQGMLNRKH